MQMAPTWSGKPNTTAHNRRRPLVAQKAGRPRRRWVGEIGLEHRSGQVDRIEARSLAQREIGVLQ